MRGLLIIDIPRGGTKVPGPSVHAAFMAALGSGYAMLASNEELAGL